MQEVNEVNTKNYQLWNHRRAVVEVLLPTTTNESERKARLLQDSLESDHTLDRELAHLDEVFRSDAKHYHAWAHRQWLALRHNDFWEGELSLTGAMIKADVLNNSAWNHR